MGKAQKTDREVPYTALYRLFDDVTPLKQDCGAICGGACCRGDDTTGMLLFPGEETTLRVIETEGRRLAVCDGTCDRANRPLSCRIFPLFPTIDERGKITVKADLRGAAVCPLVRQYGHVRFDPHFLRRVKKTGRLLVKDAACRAFLEEISAELTEAEALCARWDADN